LTAQLLIIQKGAAMSPTQTDHELIRSYYLALSLIGNNQQKFYWQNHRPGEVSTARMKLMIECAKQNYQLIKK